MFDKKVEKASVEIDEKKRISDLEKVLIWIRDNVVHGNEKHVEKINRILRGEE